MTEKSNTAVIVLKLDYKDFSAIALELDNILKYLFKILLSNDGAARDLNRQDVQEVITYLGHLTVAINENGRENAQKPVSAYSSVKEWALFYNSVSLFFGVVLQHRSTCSLKEDASDEMQTLERALRSLEKVTYENLYVVKEAVLA